MKTVEVEVHTLTKIIYEWTCPDCMTKTSFHEIFGRRNLETIKCRRCGVILYRQGPGLYGTEL